MSFYVISAYSLIILGLFTTGESTLPITTCKRNSIDYSACLTRFLEKTWPRFVPGLPEINFPSLDPIHYKYGKIVFNSGEINSEVIFSNFTASGLSNARFYDVRTYFRDDIFHLEVDVQVPRIFIEGSVKANGTIGIFRLAGEANVNATVDDTKGTWILTGHVVNDTIVLEHFRTLPSIRKIKIYFDDFFQGNKELNNLLIIFVNEFWPSLYRVVLPITSNAWDPWLVDIINNIFSKVPFSKLFP